MVGVGRDVDARSAAVDLTARAGAAYTAHTRRTGRTRGAARPTMIRVGRQVDARTAAADLPRRAFERARAPGAHLARAARVPACATVPGVVAERDARTGADGLAGRALAMAAGTVLSVAALVPAAPAVVRVVL
jgi:hypothetical protein